MAIGSTELIKYRGILSGGTHKVSPASTNPIAQSSNYRSNIARLGTGELHCKIEDWYNAHELLGTVKHNDIVVA